MSYVPQISPEQAEALYSASPDDLRKLDADRRIELALQHADLEARRKEAFWNAVSSAVTIALPLLAFFGIERWTRGR